MMTDKRHDEDSLVRATSPRAPGKATNIDDERLGQLGFESQLNRASSLSSLIALCLCLMGTWEGCSSVIAQALTSGGAPCLLYNYIFTFLCTIAIGLSLGEIASIYPTAGGEFRVTDEQSQKQCLLTFTAGQYHWVTALYPVRGRKFIAWMTGWITIGGQIVLTASIAFACGLMTQALITMNSQSYRPTRWQALLLYWVFLFYGTVMNLWGSKLLPTANLISGNASFVFTEVYNETGWSSDGVAWLVGLISTVYPFLGYDAACHLAEELPDAARNVPLAMIGSIVLNGLMGLAYAIILLFSTSKLEGVLTTPLGFPIPANAIYVILVLQMLIGFIYLGNTTAFNAVLSMAIIGTYTSYALPVVGMLLNGRRMLSVSEYGPFKLRGCVGPILNVIANAFMVLSIAFSAFPSQVPVSWEMMNYSTGVMIGWSVFGVLYYTLKGRKQFRLPIILTPLDGQFPGHSNRV
ncbi:amino acid permease [Colletotrichum asianum]